MAGKCFWFLFAFSLLRAALVGHRDELLCFLISTAPFMNLLRSYAFYNVILAAYLGVVGFYFLVSSQTCQLTMRRFKLFIAVVVWSGAYYALSFLSTHDYVSNLRLFEFTFSIFCLLLLSRNRRLLGAALIGMIFSAWLVGMAMIPQMGVSSDRLGIMEADGRSLGNPAQLGLPLALGFLMLVIDRGQWLDLENKPIYRWSMFVMTTILLALTTSRMSWLVAFAGLVILLLVGKKQRAKILIIALFGVIAINLVLLSPYGPVLKRGWDRTFSDTRSTRKKTSGRSDQWIVSEYAFKSSLSTIVHGYGPGMGPEVYARYSREIPGITYGAGKKVALHSLFMQVMVEAGVIGLLLLFAWMAIVFVRLVKDLQINKAVLPIACFLGYVLTVITISGNDITSGVLLGLGLLGTGKQLKQVHS
ncbi:MAG: O-antigen polymerase [Verrucomicrobiales bacterium]|nr:O-antigen polymerase [Verrucomicrobiales bacterium]